MAETEASRLSDHLQHDHPPKRSSNGLRITATAEGLTAPATMADALRWAADEIDRLNAIIKSSDDATTAHVRSRMYGIIAWHVNREHADLSDYDLVRVAIKEFERHWGRAIIDPNE